MGIMKEKNMKSACNVYSTAHAYVDKWHNIHLNKYNLFLQKLHE